MLIDTFISAWDVIKLSCGDTEPGFQSPLDPSPLLLQCKAGVKITSGAIPYLRDRSMFQIQHLSFKRKKSHCRTGVPSSAFCSMLIKWDFLMFSASSLKYWFFAGFLNYLQSMKEWAGWSFGSFCVMRSVLFDLWKTYFKTKSCNFAAVSKPPFPQTMEEIKNSASQIVLVSPKCVWHWR